MNNFDQEDKSFDLDQKVIIDDKKVIVDNLVQVCVIFFFLFF